jgi:hypothetical protein
MTILDPQGQPLLDPQGDPITEPGGAPVEVNIAIDSSISVTTSSTVSPAASIDSAIGATSALTVSATANVDSTIGVTSTSAVSVTGIVPTAVSVSSVGAATPGAQISSTVDIISGIAPTAPTIAAQIVGGFGVTSSTAGSVSTAIIDTFGVTTITAGTHIVVVSSTQEINSTVSGTGVAFIAVSSAIDVTTSPLITAGALPTPLGGLRARLVRDSLVLVFDGALNDLGWYDTDRRHRPVRLTIEAIPLSEPIEPNLIMLTVRRGSNEPVEIGSDLSTSRSQILVDIFAEDESLGEHLWGDIRDVLRGRIGSTLSSFPILDLRQSTPTILGYAQLFDVSAARLWAQVEASWQRRWFRVEAFMDDTYFGEPIEV